MDTEALGKILGMAMAYGVSFLGLVLAYYNYRKRIMKAETVFTGKALAVFIPSFILVVVVLTGTVWFALSMPKETTEVVMTSVLPAKDAAEKELGFVGIAVPAAILLFSFWVTWMLYRHFMKRMEEGAVGKMPGGVSDDR